MENDITQVLAIIAGIAGFVVFFFALWCGVTLLVSLLGGWRSLSMAYKAEGPIPTPQWTWVNGMLRLFGNYRFTLNVGTDARGLYLSVNPFFKLGHPPLFIPWSELSVDQGGGLFSVFYTQFRTTQVPGIPVRISKRVGNQILQQFARELRVTA